MIHRLPAGLALTLAAAPALAQSETLTVYAPDYFASEWGPGPAIEAAFEAECGCDLEYQTGDLMPRLLLEGARTEADVAIGLDSTEMARARETGLFAPHGAPTGELTLPIAWEDEVFLPFNWSYLAFVYDNEALGEVPASFAELVAAPDDLRIAIQDPRSSVSGLSLALWADEVFGDEAEEKWAALAPKIVTVTPGWSESYGLFTEGEVDMVLSYTTSPAYHRIAEEDDTVSAAIFEEGHYMTIELAAMLEGTDNPDLARRFMEFVVSDTFQEIIPTSNWSYPSAMPAAEWPEGFRDLPLPEQAIWLPEAEASEARDPAIAAWQQGLSR
ncbi:thiamine ABC transporter substrate-binding protein [Limimaricola pyoseonensis]|uniref:Thiamine transport system substrate-binding protein n=1 Tax=Limimaricola pyoseonensis TaxID=521013 RepID=A0A1G7EWM1_9RHOB|nr:thiamine ABC transporter substrate binding subunit [Limimaricola pyoseonensis]SDE68032.1 thiamine transport system substrate-binding protein [Limimaricola pyoseonensis]